MALSIYEKMRLRAKALSDTGVLLNSDAELEAYAKQEAANLQQAARAQQQQQQGEISMLPVDEPDTRNIVETGVENLFDFIGGGLWSAMDTALFGAPGMAWRATDRDSYNAFMQEMNDTTFGRVGSTVGGLAGFMAPMGWVGKGTSLLARSVRGAGQAGKLARGEKVAGATTRILQQKGAQKILKESEKAARNVHGQALTADQSLKISKSLSDDAMGFAWQGGFQSKIGLGKGRAYELEHGADAIAMVKEGLRNDLPTRLAAQMSKHGVNLTPNQMGKLSDKLIDIYSTKPINSIESIISNMRIAPKPVMKVMGAITQEAVNFGIVGTVMDATQYATGDLETTHDSFGMAMLSRVPGHMLMGGAFGGIGFIPGGTNMKWLKSIRMAQGKNMGKINEKIRGMSLEEAKAHARLDMRNNAAYNLKIDGVDITERMLRGGRAGLNESFLPKLKTAMIERNNYMTRQFKGPGYSKVIKEMGIDFAQSFTRMGIGATVFNWHALEGGHFDNMHPGETFFHLALGAWMTRQGKPLFENKDGVRRDLFHFGERPYYYNHEMNHLYKSMESMGIRNKNITEIAKQYEGNIYTDWLNRNPIQDVENVLGILKKKDIIYDVSLEGERPISKISKVETPGEELVSYLEPLNPYLRTRNLKFNPNFKKAEAKKAIEEIQNLESVELSTSERKVNLTSGRKLALAMIKGSSNSGLRLMTDQFEAFRQQVQAITGNPDAISKDGRMQRINIDTLKKEDGTEPTLTESAAIKKFIKTQENFHNVRIIQMEDIAVQRESSVPVKLTTEKLEKLIEFQTEFEHSIGRELYGTNASEAIDMNDPGLWSLMREVYYGKSIESVYDVMLGREVPGLKKEDSANIKSLIKEVLSHKDNMDHNIIGKLENITLNPEGFEGTNEELGALRNFLTHIWSISSTKRQALDSRKVEVPWNKVMELKEKLVEAGMPDPIKHHLDGRMENWYNRTINHGIDENLAGRDPGDYKATVIKRLLLNGIISSSSSTRDGRTTRLGMPEKLTHDMLRQIIRIEGREPTEKEGQPYIDAWENVRKELDGIITFREDSGVEGLTERQLSSIITADNILRTKKFVADHEQVSTILLEGAERAGERAEIVKDDAVNTYGSSPKPSEQEQITALMAGDKYIQSEYNNIHRQFNATFAGGKEIGRISAFLHFFKTSKDKEGKNILELLDMMEGKDVETMSKISERIKELQAAIGEHVANRPDIRSQFSEMRNEEVQRRMHEEIEGTAPDPTSYMTPEKFFTKYEVMLDDALKNTSLSLSTQDSAADVLWNLYKGTVIDGKIKHTDPNGNIKEGAEAFTNRLFDMAKTNRKDASDSIRAEVQTISNLMERRFSVKRLSLNIDSGKGTYENTEISKGFLTDMWVETFGAQDMVLADGQFIHKGRFSSLANNPEAFIRFQEVLSNEDFFATLGEGSTKYEKLLKNDRKTLIETEGKDLSEVASETVLHQGNIPIHDQYMKGKRYVITVDENIDLVISHSQLQQLGEKFVGWYDTTIKDPYVINARNKVKGADDLFRNNLDIFYKHIKESTNEKGEIDFNNFANKKLKPQNNYEYVEDAAFTMFNVMYGKKIEGDWLQDAYFDVAGGRKHYKYKRLAQNLGYSRNGDLKRQFLKEVWIESNNDYNRELVDKYTDMDTYKVFTINDSNKSKTGEDAKNLITDNRSVAEHRLKEMWDRRDITDRKAYDGMMAILRDSNSINAEHVNAMTAVRRSHLDYLLLLDGKHNLIGESSGQKPVGLTSFEADGKIHVFYNKTHYFYDSKLEKDGGFFEQNPGIEMLTFTSGTKKNKIINKETLENEFVPYDIIPKATSGENMASWINNIRVKDAPKAIQTVKFNQTLSGVSYSAPHDVKISKQFENYGSAEHQRTLYEYARMDMIEAFPDVTVKFFSPENTRRASDEAKSFLPGERKGNFDSEIDNASFAHIWIERDGVPFSAPVISAYETFIKRRYIDDAGVFDGYTDAGGSAILRGNLATNLDIPIYEGIGKSRRQIKLGEANIGAEYLERKLNYLSHWAPGVEVPGVRKRSKYREASTLTMVYKAKPGEVAIAEGKVGEKLFTQGRDIIVDMKTLEIIDPFHEGAKITESKYKGLHNMVDKVTKELKDGKIETYGDVIHEVRKDIYGQKFSLGIVSTPTPRTGPHDVLVLKVRSILNKKDGGLLEMNPYDVTMRAQRDYDTDKIYFFMDTPFALAKEAYLTNGTILEAQPFKAGEKTNPQFDPFNNNSFKEYNRDLNNYKRLRGPVIKMHRKITLAQNIFEGFEGIDIGGGRRIVFDKSIDAKQRLVNDSQGILDIYDGIPKFMEDGVDNWTKRTLFGHTRKSDTTTWRSEDKPFFKIESTDVNGNKNYAIIENKAHQLMIEKLLSDYGRLLNLEGSIWESGLAKDPSYKEMVEGYRQFKDIYSDKMVNYNFYNYLKKRGLKDEANQLFYGGKATELEGEVIKPIMSDIASNLLRDGGATVFMKSLNQIARKDYLTVQETFSPAGDHFNAAVNKWVGKYRDEALKVFQMTESPEGPVSLLGERMTTGEYSRRESRLQDMMWEAFRREQRDESLMVQIGVMEEQIQRAEWGLSEQKKKSFRDQADIDIKNENLLLKKEARDFLLRKLSIEPDPENLNSGLVNQKYIRYREGKNNKIEARGTETILIYNKKNAKVVAKVRGDVTHTLTDKQIAVKNPVILKAITQHDLIDGIAWTYATRGYHASFSEHRSEPDYGKVETEIRNTKKKIRDLHSSELSKKGLTDWPALQAKTLSIIENGVEKVNQIAHGDNIKVITKEGQIGDKYPEGKEHYGLDFVLSLLSPDHSGNLNEYYFSPKTSGFHPAVRVPSKSVISGVMHAIDAYDLMPQGYSRREFIGELAQLHRGFYDATVAGQGFHEGMARLAQTSLDGAILNHAIKKVTINPFMSRKDYKTMKETMDMYLPVKSDIAELFRELLEDGRLVDPYTFMILREQLIKDYGHEMYDSMIKESRGQQVFDGLMTKTFGHGRGEGQLIGEITSDRHILKHRNVPTHIPSKKRGIPIDELLRDTVGFENGNKDGGC